SQIEEKYKWDLTKMYASDDAWQQELSALDALIEKLPAYAGKLTQSAQVLREYLDAQEVVERKMSTLYCYASLRRSEDTRDQQAQIMVSKAQSKMVKLGALLSFVEPEILSMTQEQYQSFLNDPALQDYRFTLEDLWRSKAHTLTEPEEKLLAG